MIVQKIKCTSKKAFSMVTAIFVIVIMATLTSFIMNVTGKTIKETTQQYQKEQAALLARSYTEQALLYAIHYDRNTNANCINTINATFGPANNLYTIQVNMLYAGDVNQLPNPNNPNGCNILENLANPAPSVLPWATAITTGFRSTLSVIIDVYVSYKDFDDPENRDITFHRRTLQKL